jgi:hypothetical protein
MTERKTQWIVTDKNGNPWGPFETTEAINAFVKRKWPNQEQDPEHHGEGWDVRLLRSPEE